MTARNSFENLKGGTGMKRFGLVLSLLAVLALAEGAYALEFVTIGSGGVGGTYYPLGGAMAEILNKAGIDVKATSRATAASKENCRLVASGKAHIGMSMGSTLFQAVNGVEAFKEDGKLPLQILMNMYPAPQHLVAVKGSGIEKFEDIKGKRVSLGAPGGGDQVLSQLILKEAGIDPEKDIKKYQLTQPEGVRELSDGNIDAVFWNFAIPGASVLEVSAKRDIVLVPLPEDLVKRIVEKNPFLLPFTIKKGTYAKVDSDVLTIADANYLVVKEGMKEKLAYDVVKTFVEKRGELMNVTKQAEHFAPEEASLGIIPFTPGAVKYFTEKGVTMKK